MSNTIPRKATLGGIGVEVITQCSEWPQMVCVTLITIIGIAAQCFIDWKK